MNLFLMGHDYRYGVEQMLMTLFPGEKPRYDPEEPEEDYVTSALTQEDGMLFATSDLCWGGLEGSGEAQVPVPSAQDELAFDRAAQIAVKLAFYRAALQVLPEKPRWGALTGVRPVKLPTRVLRDGGSEAAAATMLVNDFDVDDQEAAIAAGCATFAYQADQALAPESVAAYIGVPFCPSRCAYCSFVSAAVGKELKLMEPYLAALHKELRAAGAGLGKSGARIACLYVGGGTPTTLSALQLKDLLEQTRQHLDLSRCTEITVEAGRPDTITAEKLRVMQALGVTRISVNPQSMHDETLQAIGRGHTVEDTRNGFRLVAEIGGFSVNADLIMGLPGETVQDFQESLDAVITLAPENITVHTLSLKRAADLNHHETDGDELAAMYAYSLAALPLAGYEPYYLYRQKEMGGSFANIGWTKPGHESVYNLCMMEELRTTIGLGATAMSKLVSPTTGKISRLANPKYAAEYVRQLPHILTEKERGQWFIS